MITIWKAAAIVMLTAILSVAVGKTEKDFAVVLTSIVCCSIACMAVRALSDVIGFVWKLSDIAEYYSPFTETILKIAGISVITELTALISIDAGCNSLEKAMHFLGNALILSVALPLFESFVDLILEILNMVC